jgi:hypothetical protein
MRLSKNAELIGVHRAEAASASDAPRLHPPTK